MLGLLSCLPGCRPAEQPSAPERPASARRSAPGYPAGFEVLRAGLPAKEDPSRAVQVTAARVDPRRLRLRVVTAPKARASWPHADEVARRHVALAAINGGYFDDQNRPLGLLVSDGKVINRLRRADWGVFALRGGRAEVVHTRRFAGLDGVDQAVQCGPRLVADGRPTQLKTSLPDQRAAVGVDDQGRVLLAATTRGFVSLAEFAALLARPVAAGGLGCRDATNLDGGPSAQLCIPGAADLRGVYGMPTHLIVVRR